MNKNTITAGAAALVAVIAVSGFAFVSFAQNSENTGTTWGPMHRDGQGVWGQMHGNLSEEEVAEFEAEREARWAEADERRSAMQEAIESGYSDWKALVEEVRGDDAQILDVINEDNFAEFQAAHDKIFEGQDLVEEGRAELEAMGVERMGMGPGLGMGKGHGMGMNRGMGMHRGF